MRIIFYFSINYSEQIPVFPKERIYNHSRIDIIEAQGGTPFDEHWRCTSCTSLNLGVMKCEVCYTPRPYTYVNKVSRFPKSELNAFQEIKRDVQQQEGYTNKEFLE